MMTQTERLLARILKLCKENPSRAVGLTIITDAQGEPLMWFPGFSLDVEGDDKNLVALGVKPPERRVSQ